VPGLALKIHSAEFVTSAGNAAQCPKEERVEIALSGRSNVGKSSLLNSLLGRKALALVSGTPGKTQRLNYFLVNEAFHLVDLPGYGYAKAPESSRDQWRRMMQQYLRKRRQLAAVVQLVDSRHEPSREDREMVQWLLDEELPFFLVATKADKLKRGERAAALRAINEALQLPETQPVVLHSSQTGEGRDALLAWIEQTLVSTRLRDTSHGT
jgi:GTP-binding protein